MTLFKIVRIYQNGKKRVIDTGLTLEQAQAHCQDSQTSSRTCTNATGRKRTRLHGPWFDTYTDK